MTEQMVTCLQRTGFEGACDILENAISMGILDMFMVSHWAAFQIVKMRKEFDPERAEKIIKAVEDGTD